MRGRGLLVALGAVAAVAVALLAATGGPVEVPYGTGSVEPAGYSVVARLLADRGVAVREMPAARVAAARPGPGDVVVVPAPQLASAEERRSFGAAARRGATVVVAGGATDGPLGAGAAVAPPRLVLAETEALLVGPGRCEVRRLRDLGEVDGAFGAPVEVRAGERACFPAGSVDLALVAERAEGAGRVVRVGAPEMFVNARLWPDKERGGDVTANAAVLLALVGLGDGAGTDDGPPRPRRALFVEARPSPGAPVAGTRTLGDLLPVGVRLFLVQLAVAVAVYAWWRGRRLGEPVRDRVPVEVAGSELTEAVGDLRRRRGDAAGAAAVLRADARRVLAERLGLGPGAPPSAVVDVVAARCGRPAEEIRDLLADPPEGRTVSSNDAVVRLARDVDRLRSEVLHEQPV